MRRRTLLAGTLAVVLVLGLTAPALADPVLPTLTISASPTAVMYPHGSALTVAGFDADPATATILAMPAGASVWTTTTLTATTATPTVTVNPKLTTAYMAVVDGVSSDPVTVTVATRLVKPQVAGSIRLGRTVTIKSVMQPREMSATVTLTIFKQVTTLTRVGRGRLKKSTSWVQYAAVTVPLTVANSSTDRWSMRWQPTELGYYRIVVSHQDGAYGLSSAIAYTRVRR
jgi:hypothetical protein